jgi:hypothetical protein
MNVRFAILDLIRQSEEVLFPRIFFECDRNSCKGSYGRLPDQDHTYINESDELYTQRLRNLRAYVQRRRFHLAIREIGHKKVETD